MASRFGSDEIRITLVGAVNCGRRQEVKHHHAAILWTLLQLCVRDSDIAKEEDHTRSDHWQHF